MNQTPALSRAEILQIHDAAVEAGLPASRGALLAGLDPAVVSSLSVASTPAAQCLSDLHALASAGSLRDGTTPLAVWLQNAVTLSGARPLAQVFEDALARLELREREENPSLRRPGIEDREDRFLAQVERICRLRQPAATISRLRAPPPFAGALEVSHVQGPILVIELIGALDSAISEKALAVFARQVDAPYRAGAPSLRTTLVHGGSAAPAELAQRAYRQGILFTTYTEYQGLIDFSRYLEGQTRRLEADLVYPPSLYVEQPARVSIGGREETATASALGAMWELLESPHPRFALILGDFGAGKTFLLHELARRMVADKHPLVPVLVEMRALEKQRSLGALIAQHFASADVGRIDVDAFRYMLAEGRIALLFDGFDELALRLTYDRALEHFDTLIEAAKGSAKVVLTSRTQHFLTDGQVKRALAERAEQLPGYRLVTLQPFGPPQIRQFLVNRLQDEREADARLALLDEVKDLLGLSKVPRLLGFIADIAPEKLDAAKEQAGEITAAKLYEVLIDQWLDGEHGRLNPPGAPRGIPRAGLRAAVTEIALLLWGQTARTLTEDELKAVAVPGAQAIDASVLAHQLGSGSLLVRDAEGAFSFLHQSVLEWLVADAAARELARGAAPAALRADAMSDLMADFFASLATPEAARGWAGRILHGGEAGHAKDNALRVLRRLARGEVEEAITDDEIEVVKGPNLAGQDLAGRDLTGADLRKADLRRADLRGATLVGARLEGASLAGARLARADLRGADLQGADLRHADLSFARLLGADLREVKGPIVSLRAAKLVGAKIDPVSPRAFALLVAAGAAPPAPSRVEPMVGPALDCYAIAWSPQGDWLVTGHRDGTVWLWDAVTGHALRTLTGHTYSVRSVAFSPDGLAVASGSEDKTVRLWEVSSGRALHTFEGHTNGVSRVVFGPEGKTLASGSLGNAVRLWDVSSGRALRTFEGHTNWVRSVAFGPDGKTLASGSDDKTIMLWDVTSGLALRTFEGHTNWVRSVAFGPDGKTLVSASDDKTVRLWEVSSGRALRTFGGHTNYVRSEAFGPDGKTLVSAYEDTTIRLWDVSSGRVLRTFEGHTNYVRSVAFGPGGKTLASGSDDKTIRLWDVSSGRVLRTFEGRTPGVFSVTFGPEGKTLASASWDKTVRLWDVSSGRALRTFEGHTPVVSSVAFGPEGRTLASGSWDKAVRLWDVSSGRALRTFEGHTKVVSSVAFGPEGTLASGSWDETVRLWDVDSGRALRTFEGHTKAVSSVAFGPEGTLASGSWDETVRLWDLGSGRALRTFEGHTKAVSSVAFGSEDKTFASGSTDKTVRLWEVSSSRVLRTFEGHTSAVQSVAFGPEGTTLASGSDDRTVRLWDIATGRLLRIFAGHLGPVQQVAFHPHGRFLASAGLDGTVRLWDIATGTCLAILLSTPEGWAAFTPDGHYKLGGDIAGSFWHVIGLCRFEPGELDPYLPAPLLLPDDAPLVPLP